MFRSLGRWLGSGVADERTSRSARQSKLTLEGLDERALPGSAAAGVLGTCMTGPAAQIGSFDIGGVGEHDPLGGASGGVIGD
jgi:hypothetical protein